MAEFHEIDSSQFTEVTPAGTEKITDIGHTENYSAEDS